MFPAHVFHLMPPAPRTHGFSVKEQFHVFDYNSSSNVSTSFLNNEEMCRNLAPVDIKQPMVKIGFVVISLKVVEPINNTENVLYFGDFADSKIMGRVSIFIQILNESSVIMCMCFPIQVSQKHLTTLQLYFLILKSIDTVVENFIERKTFLLPYVFYLQTELYCRVNISIVLRGITVK